MSRRSAWFTRSQSQNSPPSPGQVARPGETRILFAGRLSPEKGIYVLLEMLHIDIIAHDPGLTFTATTAGADKPQGKIIERLLSAHPGMSLVASRKTPAAMAPLMARHDIVVMPSNSQYWHETFGIVSVEAQRSGCRVVASDDGGLPETDCGGMVLVSPDNAEALAWGIRKAAGSGPLPTGSGATPGPGSPSASTLTGCLTYSPGRSRSRPRSSSGSSKS